MFKLTTNFKHLPSTLTGLLVLGIMFFLVLSDRATFAEVSPLLLIVIPFLLYGPDKPPSTGAVIGIFLLLCSTSCTSKLTKVTKEDTTVTSLPVAIKGKDISFTTNLDTLRNFNFVQGNTTVKLNLKDRIITGRVIIHDTVVLPTIQTYTKTVQETKQVSSLADTIRPYIIDGLLLIGFTVVAGLLIRRYVT